MSRETTVFPRGSVLDYWLAHSEGMTVEPLDAVVEQVVASPPSGRAERLIVRKRTSRRVREIAAKDVEAVDPARGLLLLERKRKQRRTGRTLRATGAGVSWLAPRTGRAAVEAGRDVATGAGFVAQLVADGAVLVGRGAFAGYRALSERGRSPSRSLRRP